MKAVVKTVPERGAVLMDVPAPTPAADELLVKVLAAGICGSDRDVYEYKPSKHGLPLPVVMGHEFFGEVVGMGAEVKGFEIGEAISSDCHMPCGQCYLCRTGRRHLCMKRGLLGHQKDGCFAEYIAVPAVAAFHMPPNTLPEHGALMEPMGVVYHAAQRVPMSGKSVLIMGLGALGLMMADAARTLGASRVIVCSTSDAKLQEVLACGADFGINSKSENVRERVLACTGGHGAEVTFEMSGNEGLYNLCLDCTAVGGTMVVVGVPAAEVIIHDYVNRVIFREITITTSFGRLFYETWELMKDLLEIRRLNPARYIGRVFPLAEFEQGFEAAKSTAGRVILLP